MKVWKVLGLAGLAGVAATGVVIARDQRARAELTPDEVRERLHQRLAESAGDAASGLTGGEDGHQRPVRDPAVKRRLTQLRERFSRWRSS